MSVFLILLSSGISILSGILLDRSSPGGTANYRAIYYGARCVIERADPYMPAEFLRVYGAENGGYPAAPFKRQLFVRAVTVCVNLPTTLLVVAPLAMFPWGLSHAVWLFLLACSLTGGALLAYDLSSEYAPRLSLFLICFMMANCQVQFATGNTAGISVGLCVIAVWCFVRQRMAWAGVLCLAISLALKPHDAGLVWFYLLLAGGALRKRSLQALALTAILAIAAVLWVSSAAPHWSEELRTNLAATSAHGDISDPGPANISRKGSADMIIDLQSVVSVFKDDPHFYNPLVYAICGLLVIVWSVKTIRTKSSPAKNWYSLAVAAPLTLLASYHRPYDAKLLLLAIPAYSILWASRSPLRRTGSVIITLAVILTADIPLAILSMLTRNLNLLDMSAGSKIASLFVLRPAPCILLIASCFSLGLYGWCESARFVNAGSRVLLDASHEK